MMLPKTTDQIKSRLGRKCEAEDGEGEEEERKKEVELDRKRGNFPTDRRVERRAIKEEECPPLEVLEEWVNKVGVKIGPLMPEGYRHKLLCGLWTCRDLDSTDFKGLPVTDLIQHRVYLRKGSVPYAVRHGRRMSKYQEYWLTKVIMEGLECGMYERTPYDEPLSLWSAPPVLVTKNPNDIIPSNIEEFEDGPPLRITFNYSGIHEDLPAIEHVLQASIHDMLSNPNFTVMSKGDLKHGYWVVSVEKGSCPILAFSVPGIGQLRPTRMPQGCWSSSHTMAELGKIAFGAIPAPNSEPPLIGENFGIFVDDMFAGDKDKVTHFHFIFNQWFP